MNPLSLSPTPRTDAHAQIAIPSGGGVRFLKGCEAEPGYLVSTDFARELERELCVALASWDEERQRALREADRVLKLRAALEFYASPENYRLNDYPNGWRPIWEDAGAKAREALAANSQP